MYTCVASSDVDSGDTESGLLTVVGTRPQLALPAQPTRSEEENIFYVSINISLPDWCWRVQGWSWSVPWRRACLHPPSAGTGTATLSTGENILSLLII